MIMVCRAGMAEKKRKMNMKTTTMTMAARCRAVRARVLAAAAKENAAVWAWAAAVTRMKWAVWAGSSRATAVVHTGKKMKMITAVTGNRAEEAVPEAAAIPRAGVSPACPKAKYVK